MANLIELRNERLRKLETIKSLGLDPYPPKVKRDFQLSDLVENFDQLLTKQVYVVGRIETIRRFGQISFIKIYDSTGQIQLFLNRQKLELLDSKKNILGYDQIPLLDSGDYLEVYGQVVLTKTNEKSIEVKRLKLITKTLRSLPTKLQGFTSKEERLRRRYVDLNVNQTVRERFIRRSHFWSAVREFLDHHQFIEINTPILEHTTGGADANPFVTHMDALDQDFYLRISQELPLKRLLGGGFEKVYDIGPRFRNENYSDEHLPEHIAMESYAAFEDYQDGIKFYEKFLKYIAFKTWQTYQFNIYGHKVNLDQSWPIIKYQDIMMDRFQIDVFQPDLKQLKEILLKHKIKLDGQINQVRALDHVWKIIRAESAGPFWLIGEPVTISPLAKKDPDNPLVSERFHPVIGGTEMGNGYSELNDPIEQLDRFKTQQTMRDQGDQEAQMLDIDFVEMLEYGMPPACGWGMSERFFWALEGVSAREGVPFPHLKFEIDNLTKSIYPDLFGQKNV